VEGLHGKAEDRAANILRLVGVEQPTGQEMKGSKACREPMVGKRAFALLDEVTHGKAEPLHGARIDSVGVGERPSGSVG